MVELVLSLGILAFAFVGLLALLPAGMATFHKAIDASVASQISQKIVDEAQESEFNVYTSKPQAVRYFDDEGNELTTSKGAIYQVNVRIQAASQVPGSTDPNQNLAEITVQIANNPGNKTMTSDVNNLWVANPTISMTTYSTFLAGMYNASLE